MRALLILVLLAGTAQARPQRPREVKVTITLREQVAARAWLEGVKADGAEARRDLVAAYDDLKLGDGRAWLDAWFAKHKADKPPASLTFDDVPETKASVSLDRGEAKSLVTWLAPTKERTQDAATARVLLGLSDAIEDALGPAK